MSLSLFIARRIYRESDGGKQVSRPAVLIAMAGIAIGLAVMIIAVAVVIGFKSEVRNKVIGFGSHIQITNLDAVNSYETHPIVAGDSLIAALSDYPEVSHVQRYSTKPGMIKTDDAFQGMVLKGWSTRQPCPNWNPGILTSGYEVTNTSSIRSIVIVTKYTKFLTFTDSYLGNIWH